MFASDRKHLTVLMWVKTQMYVIGACSQSLQEYGSNPALRQFYGSQSPIRLLQLKRFMGVPLTSKLCAEAWKTGYECSLNPGNENSRLEMETPKFQLSLEKFKPSK